MKVNTEQLIGLARAAKKCGLSRRHFYNLMKLPEAPPAIPIDGKSYFDIATLMDWNKRRKDERKRGAQ